ncbi:biotin--[acetyl-CoA-carboxylase] ligase [Blattabacterium cuenoti]|uniref:biotin--[acetyl-CoA-carboxylase] ligase n=1 Tax=Blattabacterium cuenoti TaxID=1653831 RepID=UPI00163C4571|nr:biotin--[acetyl-CoA-carboxylase] ligase [Blattabacterium cuenoti]
MKNFIWPIKIIYLKEVDSTNKFAKLYIKQKLYSTILNEWIVIFSRKQFKGLGKKGFWLSECNKNITFSIIFNPKNILIKNIFLINIIISNAIHKILYAEINYPIWIKWPNDIIIKNKKIGGILIENYIRSNTIKFSIIGIGINVKQKIFNEKWNATSLEKIFNVKFDIDYLIFKLVFFIQKEYLIFLKFGTKIIKKYYIDNLYMKNITNNFFYPKKKLFVFGTIQSITDKGFLLIEINNKLHSFWQEDIILTN